MRVTRTILALILAAAVSILPVGAGIASVGKSGGLAGTQSVSGCHEHGQHDGNKPADADKAACVIACASMCWANTIAPPSDQLLGRLQGTIDPVVSEGASLPHIASPPFRPPRI